MIYPVMLVGAGPGDPDLLTIKAAKALSDATVILVDDLVNPEIVRLHANPRARVTWVGKRGGCQQTPQAFIERLMIREARAGAKVVRLKGGDPMIFGRAGEEIQALTEAGLAFEVISGITSAVAASASVGVSLTHRDHSHGVAFVTAHAKAGAKNHYDWTLLIRAQISVVLYMGAQRAEQIRQEGIDANLSMDLPVLVVERAGSQNERSISSTLDNFVSRMRSEHFSSPLVIMMGNAFAQRVDHYGLHRLKEQPQDQSDTRFELKPQDCIRG